MTTAPTTPPPSPEDADRYEFHAIEARWQRFWEDNQTFRVEMDAAKEKLYVLDMFPYPSGAGLHVGHPEGYTATDIFCRYKRAKGFNVLHPMGWDAFGLPAEQYAIQTGTHPAQTTATNIATFRRQIKDLGFCYDWNRQVDTTDPTYYKWTQWIFLKLFDAGLAYQAHAPVNWCPALGTVLSNEEVIDGKSERGDHPVERRPMRQWMLRITAYAEQLLQGVDDLDWAEGIKAMQRNWIGRSEGAEVDFQVVGLDRKLRVYTTRPDTLFGATYMVVAPEHELLEAMTSDAQRAEVTTYIAAAGRKSERDRQDERKEKTGVFTGTYAINPVNGAEVPVWVADYVLGGYGTGAIMAVPGHDVRDFAFAKTYDLPIIEVVARPGGAPDEPLTECFAGEGTAINSGEFDGLSTAAFKTAITGRLEASGQGCAKINYKLRDWVFSRQRYWGEPIPIVYPCSPGVGADRQLFDPRRGDPCVIDYDSPEPVQVSELPLILPETADFAPTGDGEPPLARCLDWRFFERDGQWYARETNTMPQWAGSCWYYLRYLDPRNPDALASEAALKYWLPVDLYVGGAEHAVLHLLYARFWHKVLHDAGVVPGTEPFPRLINQGMILGEDGEKMSKSRGNVVNPDDMLAEFGTDAFRLYIMFMGPLEKVKPWQTAGLHGTRRFLFRVWSLFQKPLLDVAPDAATEALLHKLIRKVGEDTEALHFNTAIAALMEALNTLLKLDTLPRAVAQVFAVLLAPYAPHLAEELWVRLGYEPSILDVAWPDYDPARCVADTAEIPVMINGKVRAKLQIAADADEAAHVQAALANERVQQWLEGKTVRKTIVKAGKMVSLVVS